MVSGHRSTRSHSYSLFQVCFNFNNKVERLESFLQLVTVYVGPFAIAQLAPRFKLHVVYDEAVSARAGIHFIALQHMYTEKGMQKRFNRDS